MPTVGELLDQEASYEAKADFHAIKCTRLYLDVTLDAQAKGMLEMHNHHHPASQFYREFFKRYAVVFNRGSSFMDWSCRNPNACVVALIREMSW